MPNTSSRILAIDPGSQRIGLAISDPTATIATPLQILEGRSRKQAVQEILDIVQEKNVGKIVIGQALHWDGELSPQARSSALLAQALREETDIPVVLWNEYGSSQTAEESRRELGLSRKKRQEDVDHIAATVILQSFLEDLNRGPGAGE